MRCSNVGLPLHGLTAEPVPTPIPKGPFGNGYALHSAGRVIAAAKGSVVERLRMHRALVMERRDRQWTVAPIRWRRARRNSGPLSLKTLQQQMINLRPSRQTTDQCVDSWDRQAADALRADVPTTQFPVFVAGGGTSAASVARGGGNRKLPKTPPANNRLLRRASRCG